MWALWDPTNIKTNYVSEAEFSNWTHKGSEAHLFVTVSDDWQVEELTAVLFGQDGVDAGSVWSAQLLVHSQIIRWWLK